MLMYWAALNSSMIVFRSASVNLDETVDYAYKVIFDQNALIESKNDRLDDEQLLRPEY